MSWYGVLMTWLILNEMFILSALGFGDEDHL
jgi:hypothetical protein